MKGLAFRKTADVIAAFVKEHGAAGPRRAVLCTYDLQLDRFEAVVLPELTRRRRWFRTLVLADGAALQKDGVLGSRSATPSYELAPVRLLGPGVFHPKLLVLQAGAHLLVGIGSANLTPGGLGGNLELMMFVSDAGADGRALAGSALQFLDELRRAPSVVMPGVARRFLERLCVSRPRTQGGPVLHNLGQPLITQMASERPAGVERTAVVSPWHSSSASSEGVEPRVLAAVGRALGARPVVHTEGARGKGPDLGRQVRVRILKPTTIESSEELETEDDTTDAPPPPRRPATLHAKAYVAIGKRASMLWFGSANCTAPALLETAKRRGNVELLVRIGLAPSALAAFEADLAAMFDDRSGVLPPESTVRIPAPRGCILSGHVSSRGKQPRLTLDLVPSGTARTVHVARSAKRAGVIAVQVARGATTAVIEGPALAKLLERVEVPAVLWEHIKATAVPFPVSVPCVSVAAGAEELIEDLLDELAGRPPAAVKAVRRTRRDDGDDMDDDGEDDEQDRELELLTKTKHQGSLDRIAVRIELLRRRLAAAPWRSPESQAHYRAVIDKLALSPSLRRILVDHLELGRSPR